MEDTNDDPRFRALASDAPATPLALEAGAPGFRVVTMSDSITHVGAVSKVRPTTNGRGPARGAAPPARAVAPAAVARAAARERPVVRRLAVLGRCL